jgi:plasmid stability protein
MQYTIRQVPRELDRALRARARAEGKSLNETAVAVLAEALCAKPEVKHRDLSDLVGSMTQAEAKAITDAVAESDKADIRSQKRSRS